MKEKILKSNSLKFLRIDPFYEMNIRAIELSHMESGKDLEFSQANSFYELEDYLMTYSFVAKFQDEFIGFCLLTILPNQYGFTRAVVVDQLKVSKNFEGRGVAQTMFSHLTKIQKNTESQGIVFHCNLKSGAVDHLIKKWNLEPHNSLLYKTK